MLTINHLKIAFSVAKAQPKVLNLSLYLQEYCSNRQTASTASDFHDRDEGIPVWQVAYRWKDEARPEQSDHST